MRSLALIFLFLFSPSVWAAVESSPDIFLPPQQKEFVRAYQNAPISWWNFLLYDSSKIKRSQACQQLQSSLPSNRILYDPCQPLPLSKKWLHELALLQTFSNPPPQSMIALKSSLDRTLVSLSLPVASRSLNLLRHYPLAPFDQLYSAFNDFFASQESESRFQVLPFLVDFAPESKDSQTWIENIQDTHSTTGLHWAGPHIGAQVNKMQVMRDLQGVAVFGTALVLLLIGFLLITRRSVFLLLVPVLGLAIATAYGAVHWVWGSIHGLTLAFGCGLVGISMDYAFHGWNQSFDKKTWKTNTISFATTFLSFGLLLFFTAPLIRQISLFALSGLTVSFLVCFLISKFSTSTSARPIHLPFIKIPRSVALVTAGLIIGAASLSLPKQHLDFSLQRMDLTQDQKPEALQGPGLDKTKNQLGFYLASDEKDLSRIIKWAKAHSIPVLNPLVIVGSHDTSKSQQSWRRWACDNEIELKTLAQTSPYRDVFKDFFSTMSCQNLSKKSFRPTQTQSMFQVEDSILSIFKASQPTQLTAIKKDFPKTFFLTQLTEDFPRILKQQSLIFLVTCFSLCLLFLVVFFRSRSLLVFIPVVGALCGILLVSFCLGRPLSFISFVSLIILLGLTLDYGVFCTTFVFKSEKLKKVFGSIFLSALTSLAGFAPLALCGHPVLADLGLTIVSGLTGALLFTYIVYPNLSPSTDHV